MCDGGDYVVCVRESCIVGVSMWYVFVCVYVVGAGVSGYLVSRVRLVLMCCFSLEQVHRWYQCHVLEELCYSTIHRIFCFKKLKFRH